MFEKILFDSSAYWSTEGSLWYPTKSCGRCRQFLPKVSWTASCEFAIWKKVIDLVSLITEDEEQRPIKAKIKWVSSSDG